jgi:hypothetical protein
MSRNHVARHVRQQQVSSPPQQLPVSQQSLTSILLSSMDVDTDYIEIHR